MKYDNDNNNNHDETNELFVLGHFVRSTSFKIEQ